MRSSYILIVEDDPRWREALKNLLSCVGYFVIESEREKKHLRSSHPALDLLFQNYDQFNLKKTAAILPVLHKNADALRRRSDFLTDKSDQTHQEIRKHRIAAASGNCTKRNLTWVHDRSLEISCEEHTCNSATMKVTMIGFPNSDQDRCLSEMSSPALIANVPSLM